MKLSTLKLDAEREREFEEKMREHHKCPLGLMLFVECPLCTYKKLIEVHPERPSEIRVMSLREGIDECDLCAEVNARTPEVYQWVVLMCSSLARDVREALNPGDER